MYLIKGWLRLMDQILEQFEHVMPETKSLLRKKMMERERKWRESLTTYNMILWGGEKVRLSLYFGKCSSQTACAHLNKKIYFLWNMLCFFTFKYVWIPWTQTYHSFIWSQLTNAGNKIPTPEFIIVSKTLVYLFFLSKLRYIIAKHLWVKR